MYFLRSHAHERMYTHTHISVIPALFHQLGSIFLAVNLYVLNCEQLYFIGNNSCKSVCAVYCAAPCLWFIL